MKKQLINIVVALTLAVAALSVAPTTRAAPSLTVTINNGPIQKIGAASGFFGAQSGSTTSGTGTLYTYVNNKGAGAVDNGIRYFLPVPQTGCYNLSVFVPWITNKKYDTAAAAIEVHSINGTVDMHLNYEAFNNSLGPNNSNRWLSVPGTYPFNSNSGTSFYLQVGDNTGEAPGGQVNYARTVNFDAAHANWSGDLSTCTKTVPPPAPNTKWPWPKGVSYRYSWAPHNAFGPGNPLGVDLQPISNNWDVDAPFDGYVSLFCHGAESVIFITGLGVKMELAHLSNSSVAGVLNKQVHKGDKIGSISGVKSNDSCTISTGPHLWMTTPINFEGWSISGASFHNGGQTINVGDTIRSNY